MDYKLIIENLPFSITKQYLSTLLSEVALIKELKAIEENNENSDSLKTALVIVESKTDAEKIIQYVKDKKIKGRFLEISLLNE